MLMGITECFGHVYNYTPALLHIYWTLTAGAALLALLPVQLAPKFRCSVARTKCRLPYATSTPLVMVFTSVQSRGTAVSSTGQVV